MARQALVRHETCGEDRFRDARHRWKGRKRDEGDGGAVGVVVCMQPVGDSLYTA